MPLKSGPTISLVGQRIGAYRLTKLVNQGPLAWIYEAWDTKNNRPIGIKVLHPYLAVQDPVRRRFIDEARVLSTIEHPNIARVLGFDTADGYVFTVMELIGGSSIRSYMRVMRSMERAISFQDVIQITRQMADALHYALQMGLIHRGNEPENIVLHELTRIDYDNNPPMPVLTDFVLAHPSELPEGIPTDHEGIPFQYLSPEKAQGLRIDARSSVYELGTLMYELATGRTPFQPKSMAEAIRMYSHEPIKRPSELRADIPSELEDIIMHALERDPPNRYQSADEMSHALQAALSLINLDAEIEKLDRDNDILEQDVDVLDRDMAIDTSGSGEAQPPAPPSEDDALPTPFDAVPSYIYLSISLRAAPKWQMNALYNVTVHASIEASEGTLIKLPNTVQEVTLIVMGSGISVRGGARFTMPVDREAAFTAQAYAAYPGEADLYVDVYADGEHIAGSERLPIAVSLPAESEQPAQLPAFTQSNPQDRPADLRIRIYVSPRAGKRSRIDVVANSPYESDEWRDYHIIPTALITRIKERLRLAIEAPDARTRLAELRGVGSSLWHEILPPRMNELYKRIKPGTRTRMPTLHTPAVLIITDDKPTLPYELAMPADQPLCDLCEVTRWVEGLGVEPQAEFPFGQVQYTMNKNVEKLVSKLPPLAWPDGGMMQPASTFRPELVAESAAAGLHIVCAGEDYKKRQTSIVPSQEDTQDWATFVKYQIAAITSKSPLVALAALCDAHSPTMTDALDDGKKSLPLEMMRAGASGVVGTWWAVTPAEDRVFWQTFYQALSNHTTLGTAVVQARAAVRAFNPTQPHWMAYYVIGDPLARGYPFIDAEGYFELVCREVPQGKEIRLMVGQAYNFEALLRRRAPAQYTGQRYRLRPWSQPPSQLHITASMCEPITDMLLISAPQDTDVIRWHFTLKPRQAGTDLLQLTGASADNTLVVMSDRYPFEIETRTFQIIQGAVRNASESRRTRREIMLNRDGYRIDGQAKSFQGMEDFEIQKLRHALRPHFSQMEQLNKARNVSTLFSDFLKHWMGYRWWDDLRPESYVIFTDTLINLPFELLLNADQFLGTLCSIGYGAAVTRERPLRNVAVLMNDDTHHQQGIVDRLLEHATQGVNIFDGSEYANEALDSSRMLFNLICSTHADVVHLSMQSFAQAGTASHLSLTCGAKAIRFEHMAFKPANQLTLTGYPLIFINATQPAGVFDAALVVQYAQHLLEMGAGAVIAPCFAIPDQFADQVAMVFYNELFSNNSLTLGEILMRTRSHLLQLGNPFGLVYMLFGSPETSYTRKIS